MIGGERNEWREGWPMVLCAGLAMGLTAIPFFSMGVFMQPLTQAFGWSRTDLTVAVLMMSTICALASPLVGAAADRWGARPIALSGCVVVCAAFAALGLLRNSIWMYRGVWLLISIGVATAGPLTWSLGIAGRFDRHRGAALALGLTGVNIIGAITPSLATVLIAHFGWRWAYISLGAGLFVACFPLACAVFHDARWLELRAKTPQPVKVHANAAPVTALLGLSLAEALRTRQFWFLGLAFTVTAGGIVGLIIHLVPLLTDQGMPASQAAEIASIISLAAIVSGAGSGFLLDRIFAPYLSAVIFVIPAVSCLLLLNGHGGVGSAVIAAAIIGTASGSEVNLVSYMSARYFGLRSYGIIYGLLFGLYAIGQGVTAFLLGASHDYFGSYQPGFIFLIIGFAVSAVVVLFLGRYPDFSANTAALDRSAMTH